MQTISHSLMQFTKYATKNLDVAHNFDHAVEVTENMLNFSQQFNILLTPTEQKLLPYAGMLHDVRDHKLVAKNLCISKEEIRDFYRRESLEQYIGDLEYIHENCSWSKRNHRKHSEKYPQLHKLLEDSDWILATGNKGIYRCTTYSQDFGEDKSPNGVIKRVCEHIHEKLLLIIDGLNFEEIRDHACNIGLQSQLHDYLDAHDK